MNPCNCCGQEGCSCNYPDPRILQLESENTDLRAIASEYKDSGKEDKMRWMEAEKEVKRLRVEADRYRSALEKILYELGVPQPGYPAPVANASDIAKEALEAGE